ncbi:Asp-tRNA(Asn)/Glu-tRNA(Gln) amidotransferase subunit GatA [Cellulosilyticum sp. I15G10I2]|uniref:Asp-tRNA(Asn)/Glu-tRNA(Gln) amidotransferase subunit GatA n=1 Tax=Cellulosilyticum sp. I15G10I2 TaxID=1892843 RepID=UPI00085CDF6F|nr:Asp-tRNA(Asn)/Glu-tRNA(Gln) amidotransferase subunit GatA [Cellulosilyticum sp. I15G10I2]
MELCDKSILELRQLLDQKEISSVELTKYYLNRINQIDNKVDSYITVCEEEALKGAECADNRIARGEAMPLTGIPISIKDNMCVEGIRTTCGSKMLENFIPPYNSTAVNKLLAEDVVILGKVSMDEFAMGGSTQTSYYKRTKNPYDTTRVPGGSSGGSAASVAARLAAASLGSDTGGSIRQPAAFCGITGMKPTYGAVSRFGLVAFASSFDQIGPLAHSAKDCAAVLNTISGQDPSDGTSSKQKINFSSKLGKDIKGLKLAIPKEFFGEGIDQTVKDNVLKAVSEYEKMGADIIEVSMPSLKYAIAAYYLIASAEASSNLARYDGIKFGYCAEDAKTYEERITRTRKEGFGEEVKRRILLGTYALSSGYYDAYYKKALYIQQKIKTEYKNIFEKCDAMITPTAPTTAFKIGEIEGDPVKMYLADICTVTVNIAGLPAISTTCGYDEIGMPIGMSVVGRAFDDATVLQIADAFESNFTIKNPKL